MTGNKLVPLSKVGIFQKIKNFVLKFSRKQKVNDTKASKEDIWGIYKKAKEGEIDIRTIDVEIVEKFCELLNEEIRVKEKIRDEKLCVLENI